MARVLAIISKQRKGLHFHEFDIWNDKIMAVGISDNHNQMVQIIVKMYMAYNSQAGHSPTLMYFYELSLYGNFLIITSCALSNVLATLIMPAFLRQMYSRNHTQ